MADRKTPQEELKFKCRICGSEEYDGVYVSSGFDVIGGTTYPSAYKCKGCSVIFENPEQFTRTMNSNYIIQKTENSTCPTCGFSVDLLADKDFQKGKPAFYICFHCHTVGESGVGKVKRIEKESSE